MAKATACSCFETRSAILRDVILRITVHLARWPGWLSLQRLLLSCSRVERERVPKTGIPTSQNEVTREYTTLNPGQHLHGLRFKDILPFRCKQTVTVFLGTTDIQKLLGCRSVVDVAVGVTGDERLFVR